jgi:hypothetical protein
MGTWFVRLFIPLLIAVPVRAQGDQFDEEFEEKGSPPADYEKALRLQKKKRWISAKKAFRRFIKKNPDSPWVGEAELRSGDNAYLGATVLWKGGPSERRIDVAVMGDGFTVSAGDQARQAKWADYCVDVLHSEKAFEEYRNYFNIYFVRLASFDEFVDPQLTPEERKKIEERNKRRRSSRKKIDYNTALDAKEAGPQGQVMMNRGLVYKWLGIANEEIPGVGDDRYVIAFARWGRLGMGGGGIANVGKPDKSVTVHEFGHAFSRLLDEYAINPNPPPPLWAKARTALAANASATDDPKKVPWAHMLKKRIKGVGIYEGGATFKKGIWRPAPSCAMNSAGARGFCPVCREATILVIYEHISPIDELSPPTLEEVKATQGDETLLTVVPMRPKKKALKAEWFVAPLQETAPGEGEELTFEEEEGGGFPTDMGDYGQGLPSYAGFGGNRKKGDRSHYGTPPEGKPSKFGKATGTAKNRLFTFAVGKLPPGRWKVTVEVRDPTRWVIKDENHLLKERATWTVTVAPKEGGRMIGHIVAAVVGFVLMLVGLGMGVTVIMLPIGIPLGLFGLGLFLWGVLEYFDKRGKQAAD